MTTETQPLPRPTEERQGDWVLVPREETEEMATAAAEAHFGKRRTAQSGGIDGIGMTVDGRDYSYRDAFKKFWKAALSAAPPPPVTTRETEDLVHSQLPVQAAIASAVTQAWMPIETAPHETTVLLYSPPVDGLYDGKIEVGFASSGRRWAHPSGGVSSNMSWHGSATHWMPLPLPPDDRTIAPTSSRSE
jgi:hypothetical protein